MFTTYLKLRAIRRLFATYPGWRTYNENYDPTDLLVRIAEIVGEHT